MYVHLQCLHISTFQFLTFLFTARRKKFKCIFKFLSMLFSAAAVVYSIRIWWNLFCCSILWNTEKSTFPFFTHISPLSSSLRSKEINAFYHTFFEGIRAKTFWYFFCRHFLYLVISCFLNWFFFLAVSIFFGIFSFHQYLCCSSFLHE